jgi:hypothetical protein
MEPLNETGRSRTRVRAVIATGLVTTAVTLLLVLLHSPAVVASTNGVPEKGAITGVTEGATVCQAGETLPAGTSAVRLDLAADIGPPVAVHLYSHGGSLITSGHEGSGWFGAEVTVPVSPVRVSASGVTVCSRFTEPSGLVQVAGAESKAAAATLNGTRLAGRMAVSYLRPGRRSWLTQVRTVMRHLGLGRAWSGTAIVLPIGLLMLSALTAGSWLLGRELR